MVRHRDPTARLRSLTSGRPDLASPAVAGRHALAGAGADPVLPPEPASGWVPDWRRGAPGPADTQHDDAGIEDGPPDTDPDQTDADQTGVGPLLTTPPLPPAAGWMTVEPADEGEQPVGPDRPADEPVRLPSRWHRLRDRWVPEQLHTVRVDPGRRGLLLLSLVSAVSAVLAALGVWWGGPSRAAVQPVSSGTTVVSAAAQAPAGPPSAASTTASTPAELVVSVTGAVHRPGLVTLPAGARVADAIAAAGGPLDGTDLTGVNLAALLSDADSVVVGAAGSTVQAAGGGSGGAAGAASPGSLINLNTADQATLETLPGVGPVMAGNIVGWRETNGPFTSVDELQEVTGIGPSRFATLAPLVTV